MKHAPLRGAIVSALLAVTGLGVFLTGGEACTTRECLAVDETLYTSGGDLPDPNTWESTPMDGTWLHFPPVTGIYVEIPEFANREVLNTTAYLSGTPTPNLPGNGNNYAEASGNLAEFEQVFTSAGSGPNAGKQVLSFTLVNGTCADYYVRIVVTAGAADAGTVDADADADAAATAATDSGDASLD